MKELPRNKTTFSCGREDHRGSIRSSPFGVGRRLPLLVFRLMPESCTDVIIVKSSPLVRKRDQERSE